MWHALVASLLLMPVGPPAPVQPAAPAAGERLPARFQHRLAELERCAESLPPGCGDPAVETLLGDLWTLGGRWAAGQLKGHPDASAEDLAEAMRKLAPDSSLGISAVRLATGPAAAYVLAMTLAGHGSVLAVARQPDGSFKAVWNLHEVALKHATAGDEISHWGAPSVRSGAAPLAGGVYALPAAPGGGARFYVDAVSRPPAGGTFPGQISVWDWDGHEPKCLFIKSYSLSVGTTRGARLEADRLELHTKEDFKRFYSCGDCPDPEAVWTLRIKADGVEDLGRQLLTPPELGTADELVDRMARQQDVSSLAALGVIRRLFEGLQDYGVTESSRYMLDSWSVEQEGESTVLHLRAADFPPLDLTFEKREGRPFATSLDIPGDDDSDSQEPP